MASEELTMENLVHSCYSRRVVLLNCCYTIFSLRTGLSCGDGGVEAGDRPGNLVAVGSMTPQIEIWDLDMVDAVEPVVVLGDKKRAKKKKHRGHRAEVMSLSWNRLQRNLLASGSADTTVRLWDLDTNSCLRTLDHHKDKVGSFFVLMNWCFWSAHARACYTGPSCVLESTGDASAIDRFL